MQLALIIPVTGNYPDQGLPGGWPGHPGHGLPGGPGHPDQGLPGGGQPSHPIALPPGQPYPPAPAHPIVPPDPQGGTIWPPLPPGSNIPPGKALVVIWASDGKHYGVLDIPQPK
jgi:hypothetical protein